MSFAHIAHVLRLARGPRGEVQHHAGHKGPNMKVKRKKHGHAAGQKGVTRRRKLGRPYRGPATVAQLFALLHLRLRELRKVRARLDGIQRRLYETTGALTSLPRLPDEEFINEALTTTNEQKLRFAPHVRLRQHSPIRD